MNKKHIVVVGLGGVGGYFGFKINQTNEVSENIKYLCCPWRNL
jgi:2-dehydropantoate 2-reductase